MPAPSTPGRRPAGAAGRNQGGPRPDPAARTARRAAQRERAAAPDVHVEGGVRLQKVLAGAGLGSRRACEVMIADGRVAVDGTVVREAGVRIDPGACEVAVDGLPLQLDTTRTYLAVNKARGVLSTMHDPEGRPSLEHYAASRGERLFHVGRLDADTEGLIILTNDGDLAHHLAHPSHQVPKTYIAEVSVKGPNMAHDVGARLRAGVELDDGSARVDSFRLLDSVPGRAVVELVLHDGRKHVVRRMLAAVDLPVDRLVRTRIGPVHLGDMRPGSRRALNRLEVGMLRTAGTEDDPDRRRTPGSSTRSSTRSGARTEAASAGRTAGRTSVKTPGEGESGRQGARERRPAPAQRPAPGRRGAARGERG